MIAMEIPVSDVRLFDDGDLPWIAQLLGVVERSLGQPWRVLLERVEHAPLRAGVRPVSPRARQAILGALRRVLGGRAARARVARRVRARVLGHPALDPAARAARITAAAAALGLASEDVEALLWADLARERPVELPAGGPPAPHTLAAVANVDLVQRELRRAREIELRVGGHAHGLVRLAARCGLLVQVAREPAGDLRLAIAGPLALFHATTVYGRALGALVPLLADQTAFELAIHCDLASGPHVRRVAPPVLLPPYASRLKPSPAARLARDLEAREHVVEREPAPLDVDGHVLFPDLALDHAGTRWFVEVVGFSTAEYLADKLARYRAAGARALLCVDARRSPALDEHPAVLAFTDGRIDADALVQLVEDAP